MIYRDHRVTIEFAGDVVIGHAEDPDDPDQVRMSVRRPTAEEAEERLRELIDEGEDAAPRTAAPV